MKRLGPLAVLAGGAAALVGLALLSVSVVQSQSDARDDVIRDFADRGRLAADLLAGSNQVSSTRQAADAQVRLSGAPSAAALQEWEGEADPAIPYTALYDATGRLLAVHPADAEPAVSESGRAALRDATGGQPATSGVTPSAGGPVIETFVPFPAGDDGVRVLLIAFPMEIFGRLAIGSLEGAAGTPTGAAYVMDAAGTLVAAVGDTAQRDDAESMVADAVRDGRKDGSLGSLRLAVSPVPNTGLLVALTAPEEELTADLPSTTPPRLALAGLGIALLAVISLGARAVRDARRLQAARDDADRATQVAADANLRRPTSCYA